MKNVWKCLAVLYLFTSNAFAYNTHGVKWPVSSVSYDASSMSSSERSCISYATVKWENETNFDWRYSSGSVNDVYFYDIDGRGGVYAYVMHWTLGNYITKIHIRFDESERWYTGSGGVSSSRLDLRSVAIHEFGHAFGVAHTQTSRCKSSVSESRRPTMCPTYDYGKSYWRTLENDDENAAQSLYGADFSSNSFVTGFEGTLDSNQSVSVDFSYEELSSEELSLRASSIIRGFITSISETKWNQDSNEYWEDVSEDGATTYTAIPFYEVEVVVADDLVDHLRRKDNIVTLTILGMSPLEDGSDTNRLTGEGVFFIRSTELSWRGGEFRTVRMPVSDPQTSIFTKRSDGLFRELATPDSDFGESFDQIERAVVRFRSENGE